MSLFFKLGARGDYVFVAKTKFSNKIDEIKFENICEKISIDEFLKRFPKEVADDLQKKVNRIKEINGIFR